MAEASAPGSAGGSAQAEIERIREEYRERDSAGASSFVYSFTNPAYVFHTQDLEWQVLSSLRAAGVDLRSCRVLEVGAGFGQIVHRLKEFGARSATGIDLMESRAEEAGRRYPTISMHTGDASAMPFEDGSFELVTQFTCLSSILDPGVRGAVAADMWRVLAPGGIALSYDMRPTSGLVRLAGRLLALVRGGRPGDAVGTPTVTLSGREVAGLFPAGDVVSSRAVTLNFELAALAGRSRLVASALGALPFLRTHQLVLVRKPGA
jgi:SAM-dependent methyltransferase